MILGNKHYIEFYQKYLNGEYAPCVGGDSVIPVDNRLSVDNMIKFGYNFKYKPHRAIGFKICVGNNVMNCRPITKLHLFN